MNFGRYHTSYRENTMQLNNRFNVLAIDDSVDEAEPNILS